MTQPRLIPSETLKVVEMVDMPRTTTDTAPEFSDEALALEFAERHADALRYCAGWGRWLAYDGTHWQFDDTLNAFDRARAICREIAAGCEKPGTASAITSAKTVAATERLAKADRRLAASTSQWDADPFLITTGGEQ
jgi:putative DNA primase/helicase